MMYLSPDYLLGNVENEWIIESLIFVVTDKPFLSVAVLPIM
jgi:hypothetical protein